MCVYYLHKWEPFKSQGVIGLQAWYCFWSAYFLALLTPSYYSESFRELAFAVRGIPGDLLFEDLRLQLRVVVRAF